MSKQKLQNSFVVNLDGIVGKINLLIEEPEQEFEDLKRYIDVVIPIYESVHDKIANHLIYICDKKIYFTQKSTFVKAIITERNNNTYHIYDKFKSTSNSYKKGYKKIDVEVSYPEEGTEPLFIPAYYRIN